MRSTSLISTAVLFLGLSTAAMAQPSDYRRDSYRDRYPDRSNGRVEALAREIEQTAAAMQREYDRNNRRPDRDEARVSSNLRELYQEAYAFRAEVDDYRRGSRDRRDGRRDLNELFRAFDQTAESLRYIAARPYVDRGMDRMWDLLRELRRDHGYGQAHRGRGRYDRDDDRRYGRYGRDGDRYRDRGRYERRYDWNRDDERRRN